MFIKKVLNFFKFPIDIMLSTLITPASIIFLVYRYYGSKKFYFSTKILKIIGVFPIRNHYYEPQFVYTKEEKRVILKRNRNLPGINLGINSQIKFLKKLIFSNELKKLNLENFSKNYKFNINNKFFEAGDAEFYYQIIRFLKPKKIIEIGSGQSTKIAMEATLKNRTKNLINAKIICIEPFENKFLQKLNIELIEQKIENLNLNWKTKLHKNDILFIDSSHVIRPDGDILKIFLEILPQLNPGVIVHFHDIFTPKNYSSNFLFEHNFFWNEQYLLETMLSKTNRYQVIAALNFLKDNRFKELKKVCPYLKSKSQPSSFYIKIL